MYVCMYVCLSVTQSGFTWKNTFRGRDKFGMGGAQDKINRARTSSAELRPQGAGQAPEWAVPTVKHPIFASKKSRHRGKTFKGEEWVKKPDGGDAVGGAFSKWAVLFRCIHNLIDDSIDAQRPGKNKKSEHGFLRALHA
ncbi:hypothetical protein V3C99_017937 [Haemonchus contortus]